MRTSSTPDVAIRNPQPFYDLFDRGTVAPYSPAILNRRGERCMNTLRNATVEDYYPHQTTALTHQGVIMETLDGPMITFSGYDYLSLIGHPRIQEDAADALQCYGTGTGGVRLLTGTNILHRRLEARLADMFSTEAAVVVTSGFMANLAVASAVIQHDGFVLADELIHRSMSDGFKLAGAEVRYYRHNNLEHLEELLIEHSDHPRLFVVTEGIFSMGGDLCPLPHIIMLKQRYGATLVLDEAHSFGVLGERGRGVTEYYGIDPAEVDIFTGSLSKAVPSNGGFIATNLDVAALLQHEASTYLFSAALDPVSTQAALTALDIIEHEPERRVILQRNIGDFRESLRRHGFNVPHDPTPIIPVLIGDAVEAYTLTAELERRGLLVSPVGFPAVRRNEAILRLCANTAHEPMMFDLLARTMQMIREG